MKTNLAPFLLLAIAFSCLAGAEDTGNTPTLRHMTLQEAVQLAHKHNHDIRIASYTVEEKQHAKEITKSSSLKPATSCSSIDMILPTPCDGYTMCSPVLKPCLVDAFFAVVMTLHAPFRGDPKRVTG